jgi:hypothetical protein
MAGLLMGAATKPELGADDRPAGPQIIAGVAGARAAAPFEDDAPAFAAYSGKIPDYVMGSDWARPASATPPPARGEVEAQATPDAADDAALAATPAVATERVAYTPPADAIEDEAPPEATGDTTPAPKS